MKTQMPLRETAKQVQIISHEEIEKNSGKDLSQLLQEQAGLIINNSYSNPAESKTVFLRGASNEFTLILVDGNPINDPSGIGGAFDLRLFPLEHISRIEILKGSQSTLYGTDAIAGVINIITDQEYEKPVGVYGGFSYGSMNTVKGNVGVKGNTGLVNYNVNFLRNSSDGISSALDTLHSGTYDKDGFQQKGLFANVDVALTDKLTFSPFFRFENFEGDYDDDAFSDGNNEFTMKLINPGADVTFKSGEFTSRISYNFNVSDREFRSGAFGVTPFKGKLHNAEAFVSSPLNQYMQIVGGLNYQLYQLFDDAAAEQNPDYNIVSPFATLILKNLDGFYLETGYRINRHSTYGTNSTYNISPAYWVGSQLKIFASFNTGFKAPTLSQLYGPYGANPKLEPQVSQSTEVGVNYLSPFDLDAQVTYYRRKIDDLIDYSYSVGYFNRDKQEDEGVEIIVKQKVSEKLNISASYDFVTGKSYTVNDSGEDTSFYNLVRRPKSKISATINYQPVQRLNLSVSGLYLGKRTDLFYNPVTFNPEEVSLAPYFLVNVYADYGLLSDKIVMFIDLKNILDKDFTETYGYSTIGFNAQAGLRFRL